MFKNHLYFRCQIKISLKDFKELISEIESYMQLIIDGAYHGQHLYI